MGRRFKDWTARFDAALAAAAARPFAYGRHDCGLFACSMARAIAGVDPAAGLRGRYRSKRALAALLREHGGSLEALAEARFAAAGFPEVAVARAQRGDLLLGQFGGETCLGVVGLDGRTGYTAATVGGVTERPLRGGPDGAWRRAWRVS